MSETRKVWIVTHCEIFPSGTDNAATYVDQVVFHVAGSLKAAEKYVRKSYVESHSWWVIQPFTVDDYEAEGEKRYYSGKGKRLHSPPYAKAMESYRKAHPKDSDKSE